MNENAFTVSRDAPAGGAIAAPLGPRLKIAQASAYDFASRGGVQTHVRELSQQLRAWGHDVRIVAPCSDPDAVPDAGFIPMGKPFPLPSRGSVGKISISVWLRSKIKRMLDEQRFDVIHMHEPFSSYVCVGMLDQSEALNVATFHAYPGSRVYALGGAKIAKPYFRKLQGRIAVSEPARDYISNLFDSTYKVIPNGVRIDQYRHEGVEPFPHLRDGMTNLLFLGRADKRKGLKYLLFAYAQLKWERPNLRLIVLGPGNPNPECERIVAERNLRDVVFVGQVSDNEKFRYLKTADIYCSPATGGESFGMVLVEAMAAGLPIVASEIPGYLTVARSGVDALTFPPKDSSALAQALATLLNDSDLRRRLSQNALRRAEDFRWERVARQVLDYYGECMEAREHNNPTDVAAGALR